MDEIKVKVFYSYSHKDEELREMFEAHMSGLKRTGYIEEWHDRRIAAGKNWENEISNNILSADLVLFLVSSDFLASDYCFNVEVIKSVERHNLNECIVIPILIRECDWEGTPFEHIQGLPKDMNPVVSKFWHNKDEAFTNIVKELKKVIKRIRAERMVKSKSNATHGKITVRNTVTGEEFDLHELDFMKIKIQDIIHAMKDALHISSEMNYIIFAKKNNQELDLQKSLAENEVLPEDTLLITSKVDGA